MVEATMCLSRQRCPLWVISRHMRCKMRCPLYPQKRPRKQTSAKGVPQDYSEAVKWYRLAASQGFGMAQYDIGYMYAYGRGVQQNYVLAHMWLNLSAARDVDGAATL